MFNGPQIESSFYGGVRPDLVYHRVSRDGNILNVTENMIEQLDPLLSDYHPELAVIITWSQSEMVYAQFANLTNLAVDFICSLCIYARV